MGQKVNPHGLRVGVIKKWDTQWFADKKDFSVNIKEDYEIRKFIEKKHADCGLSKITIERAANRVTVGIVAGRPGLLIGKGGEGIVGLKKELEKLIPGKTVAVNVTEVKKIDADAQLVAEGIAAQLEKRVGFRHPARYESWCEGNQGYGQRKIGRSRNCAFRELSRGIDSSSDSARKH